MAVEENALGAWLKSLDVEEKALEALLKSFREFDFKKAEAKSEAKAKSDSNLRKGATDSHAGTESSAPILKLHSEKPVAATQSRAAATKTSGQTSGGAQTAPQILTQFNRQAQAQAQQAQQTQHPQREGGVIATTQL